jgi:hypothetical protein
MSDVEDGYPTEAGIKKLLSFKGTPRQMIEFISSMWWPQAESTATFDAVEEDEFGQPKELYKWRIATGGWSGNEDIISNLAETFFWMRFWQSTHRGGGYIFYIPRKDMDSTEWGEHQGSWKTF